MRDPVRRRQHLQRNGFQLVEDREGLERPESRFATLGRPSQGALTLYFLQPDVGVFLLGGAAKSPFEAAALEDDPGHGSATASRAAETGSLTSWRKRIGDMMPPIGLASHSSA